MRTVVLLLLVLGVGAFLLTRVDPGAWLDKADVPGMKAAADQPLPPAVQAIDVEIRRLEAAQAEVTKAAALTENPAHRASFQAEQTRIRHSLKQAKIQRNALLDPQPPVPSI